MLTVQINNAKLEQQILDEAHASGKTTQAVIEGLLSSLLPVLDYPHLDPGKHGYIIDMKVDQEDSVLEPTLFSHGIDSADFVSNLRKTAWRRL